MSGITGLNNLMFPFGKNQITYEKYRQASQKVKQFEQDQLSMQRGNRLNCLKDTRTFGGVQHLLFPFSSEDNI